MDRGHGGRGERSPEVKRMRILLGEGFLSLYIGHMVSAGRMNPGLHPGLRSGTRFGVLDQWGALYGSANDGVVRTR